MIWALLILGGLSILIALAAWLLLRAEEVPPAPVAEPEPPPAPPPTVTVRFLNERGRTMGYVKIPAARRKATLAYEKGGLRHIFQASHQEADGTWIYRRSGRG